MSDLAFNRYTQSHKARDFFLARQPILDRDQQLIAYELLFRSAAAGPANVTDDLLATASVIAHASELGMENVVGDSLGFVNVDATVLLSDFVEFLPTGKVVLEILETVKVNDQIIERVSALANKGYRFALDDVVAESPDVQQLLPLVEIIKVDITDMKQAQLFQLSSRFKRAGKRLLAEKVETIEQFQRCLELGFDYFQGYYFAKPHVLTGKKLSPSQLIIMQLISQLAADADTAEIERSIKQDASLVLTLLRMVNTPAAGVMQRIDSLGQALIVLGRRQLQRWLQVLLYADPRKTGRAAPPLLVLATTRGRLLELMAQHARPDQRAVADIAFTVGIMSLMDALFGLPMENILEKISVADEVRQALLHRSGIYGDMLKLAEHIENINEAGPMVLPLLAKLNISGEQFNKLQIAAFEWSESISRNAA
ncbi:EAL and HDOD domain-containing protein [Noviherbaspirillum massiliense]|uniref:EAL and HDOD domain-containing protein n=1 Tax=Noviherbaspirillum massiliense TaxID=1465823 RepID=UPI00030FD6EF|nr:EAL domain-containing protein [Noviherbaspirillum massiliense]